MRNVNGRKKLLSILELFLVLAICAVAILAWLSEFGLNQDSTGYITASMNLIKTGRLTNYVNFTNWINDPAVVPYFEQPPGFPLLLAPFILLFGDPLVSALIAQSVYLTLFYLFIYLMTLRLQFSPLLRIVTLVLFTFERSFFIIHNIFWTETLFIALSVGACYFVIGLYSAPNQKRDWIFLIVLLTLTSLIRYTGVANVLLLIPFLLKRDSLCAVQRILLHQYTIAVIFSGGVLLVIFALLSNFLPNAKPGIGPMQWLAILLGVTGVFIGIAGHLLRRKYRFETNVQYPTSNHMDTSTWAIFALLGAIIPILAWFCRNIYLYRIITQANRLFQVFLINRLLIPFQFIWSELLAFHFVPRPLAALLAVGLLFLPFSRLPVISMIGLRRVAHVFVLGTAAGHFLLIWSLSIVASNENIGARYFSPVLAFLLLGILNATQQISQSVRTSIWKQLILATPLLFLFFSTSFNPGKMLNNIGNIHHPIERQLWQKLNKLDWIQSSSFFYSDDAYNAGGFIHQIFSGKPQGILWDRDLLKDPQRVTDLLSRGTNPFILVTIDSPESRILDEMISSGAIPLEKILYLDTGYLLYRIRR